METKSLPMPVVIGVIAVVVLLAGFFGWRAISGGRTDKNGVDLSQAAIRPAGAMPPGAPAGATSPPSGTKAADAGK